MAKRKKYTPKQVRTELLRMTQEKLAKKFNITDGALCNKESGRRSYSAKEIIKLAKMANIDPSNIILS